MTFAFLSPIRLCSLVLIFAGLNSAGQLILPAEALERPATITAIYRTTGQATGKGELHIKWTDSYGRVVEDRAIPIQLTDETDIRFPLDLWRAVAVQNELHVHLSFEGLNKKREKDSRDEEAEARFIARPPDRPWWDYMIIMWQDGSAEHFNGLQKVGVNAGKSRESSSVLPESLLKNNLPWYVENMATDFYSEYHRYRKDRPYNWSLLQAKELYKKDPSSKEAFKRHPSFSDPAWLSSIHDRLVAAAKIYSPYRPIFYNLADESGIAQLAGFWDFDFSDHSLDAMHYWLKDRYGTLAALNKQWGSNFQDWNAVTPDTTREAMKRTDENYSSWSDHKEWMDISFASALRMGVDAIHSVDPHARVGIEGAQMPGWGGYDYARLTSTLDAMEPYDIGDNIEIIRSLNPHIAFVTTAFASGPWEKHRIWYELLHGARGHIIWDEKNDIVQADGTIGPRGRDVAPYWKELRSGIGALLINSVRQAGPIAIHYSQPSMRTEWMLAQRGRGDAWMDRMSWTERKDSDFLRLRDSYCRLIEDQGFQYKFVSYSQLEQGELLKGGYRVFILPRSSSLSELEARVIVSFVRQGGVLVVDGDAGTFDEHSRRLAKSSLEEVLNGPSGKGKVVRINAFGYDHQRVLGTEAQLHQTFRTLLKDSGVHAQFRVVDAAGKAVTGVELQEFRNGGVSIVGLINNPPIEVDELGPLKVQSDKRFEQPQAVRLIAPEEFYVYDVRSCKSLGRIKELRLTIDPYEPAILTFSPTAIPKLRVMAPDRLQRGETGQLGLSLDGSSSAATHVFHMEVLDPGGEAVSYYSGNVLAPSGVAEKFLPLAQDEKPGHWTARVRDLISGQDQTTTFEVY
jgi:hypothetical protein